MEEDIVIPNFVLPELPEIGKNADKVFVDTNEGKKVRPLTPEEKVNAYGNTGRLDLTRKIGEYSYEDSRLFQDPSIKFQPGADMESIYAEAHPFSWGDAFDKAWDTLRINAFASYAEFYAGVKEGITEGDVNKIFNNSKSKEIADLTDTLEQIRPQFRTADERENPLSFRNWDSTIKSIIPSLGFAGAGIVDAATIPIVTSLAGGLLTLPEGGVGGAAAGFGLGLAKSAQTLKNTVTGLWQFSKNLNSVSKTVGAVRAAATTANALNAARLVGSGLFFANSEAALQGELNKREAQKELQDKHFKATGKYLSDEELDKQTLDVQKMTYLLNLPLLTASAAFQMPNLLRGKLGPALIESLPVKLINKELKAKNVGLFLTKEWAKESLSEGFEEVAQGAIDNIARDYYAGNANKSFINSLKNGTYKTLMDEGTPVEFLGGFLTGGAMNLTTFGHYNKTKKGVDYVIKEFNSSTNELVNNFSRTSRTHLQLRDALKAGDVETIKKINRNNLLDIIETGRYLGSIDAKREIISDISKMDITEFNKYTGLNVNQATKEAYTTDLLNEFDRINSLLNKRDAAFAYNPYSNDKWFKQRVEDLSNKTGQKADKIAAKLYEDSKRIIGRVMAHNEEIGLELDNLENSRPDLLNWYGSNLQTIVNRKIEHLKALNLASDQTLISSLENKSLREQAHILSKAEGLTEDDLKFLETVYKNRLAKGFYELKFKDYSGKEGHKRLLKEASYYMEFMYREDKASTTNTNTNTNTTAESTTTTTPVTPIPSSPTNPVAPITPDSSIPVTPVFDPIIPTTPVEVTTPVVREEDFEEDIPIDERSPEERYAEYLREQEDSKPKDTKSVKETKETKESKDTKKSKKSEKSEKSESKPKEESFEEMMERFVNEKMISEEEKSDIIEFTNDDKLDAEYLSILIGRDLIELTCK